MLAVVVYQHCYLVLPLLGVDINVAVAITIAIAIAIYCNPLIVTLLLNSFVAFFTVCAVGVSFTIIVIFAVIVIVIITIAILPMLSWFTMCCCCFCYAARPHQFCNLWIFLHGEQFSDKEDYSLFKYVH